MITVLAGDNSFEIDRALTRLTASFDGVVERVDGSEVDLGSLPDLLMGGTLFTDKRMVVVRELSASKAVWSVLPDWFDKISDDVHLVLLESKLDKRTKTYKDLKKVADLQELTAWGERDINQAEAWCKREAESMGLKLDAASARSLVGRVGLDQWQLHHTLQQLSVLDEVTPEIIERITVASPSENVFNLFDAALRGDASRVSEMVHGLELTDDPYMLFGLLSGQAFQLLALAASNKPDAAVAKDIGAHPFALSKLAPHARRRGIGGAHRVVMVMAEADHTMKTSGGEPWLLIERALVKIAHDA